MLILITYDVNVTTTAGERRLRKTAKVCLNYGMRVQNSVFECEITPADLVNLKAQLIDIIDPEVDSLRFYYLGKGGRRRVEHVGAKPVQDVLNDTLLI